MSEIRVLRDRSMNIGQQLKNTSLCLMLGLFAGCQGPPSEQLASEHFGKQNLGARDTSRIRSKIEPGTAVMSEAPFEGPQPKHSPSVRISNSVDGRGYDLAPEVLHAAFADIDLPNTRHSAEEQKLLSEYLFDVSGRVRGAYVRAVIETTGVVDSVHALVMDERLSAAIIDAAKQWQFTPARKRNTRVAVWAYIGVYAGQ